MRRKVGLACATCGGVVALLWNLAGTAHAMELQVTFVLLFSVDAVLLCFAAESCRSACCHGSMKVAN